MRRILLALGLIFGFAAPALALDCADPQYGYTQGQGGWYSKVDRSGPYTLDASCNPTLLTKPSVTVGGGSSSVMTYASATIGTGDSTIVAAPAAGSTSFPDLYNLSTATVCINLGATATITGTQCDAGEILLPPGWHWSPPAPIAVAVHAIASAASAQFTVGTK